MAVKVRLVPFSLPALAAEDVSGAALANVLGVAAPIAWPPEFNDADTRAWFRQQIATRPEAAGWLGYYVVATINGGETVVGTAGFKGPPDDDGTVEIGYAIVPAYHRCGIGTAAVELLLERAFSDRRVRRVIAEAPVHFAASRGLLEKCGLVHVADRRDPEDGELVIYAIVRSEL